jgi:acetylornithine deacetylase/succinyl-diaminopimelate desuccinylase-like protein
MTKKFMFSRFWFLVLAFSYLLATNVEADPVSDAAEVALQYRMAHEAQILSDYINLLSLPNNAAIVEDIRINAAFIREMMEARGITTELLEYNDTPPAIYGERMVPGATSTIMIYVHYDGQPTDPSNWVTPPFEPTIRSGKMEEGGEILSRSVLNGPIDPDWRIYARSASDDKAPIIAILSALDAMDAAGVSPSVNLKFFMEGEEERGSPNLAGMIDTHLDKLGADYWLFLDGPQDQRGNPRVVLGVRGSMGGQITLYGPLSGLHSGHYGNFAPNPISRLAHLLASMRDDDGRILIDGFYDDVEAPSALQLELIEAIPDADAAVMAAIGVSEHEHAAMRYEEALLWPALNFQGIQAGGVGALSRNVIVPSATAAIGVRMVPDQTKEHVAELIESHISSQGYFIVRDEPDLEMRLAHPKIARVNWGAGGYGAVRISPQEPITAQLIAIMDQLTEGENIVYPALGGSLPLAIFTERLHVPLVNLPIANQDNSQHAPNENIRIGHLWRGIEIYAGILAGLGLEN